MHPLLLSWLARDYPLKGAYTRHEPSEPFPDLHALTQAHSRYHSCTDNTHSGWARPRYMRPHTERSSPFQGLTAACACPKSPPPPRVSSYSKLRPRRQHVRQVRRPPAPLKPCQQARTHADRPLCSCQQLQLPPSISRDINLTHDSHSESHHPGRLES